MKIVALRSLTGICFVVLLTQCGSRESQTPLALEWSEGKAIGLSIDKSILKNLAEDSIPDLVKVRWAGIDEDLFMLGTYQEEGNRILFTPVIPFTLRLRYEVVYRDAVVGELEVPADGRTAVPSVLAVYPSQDTVPENLLKVYILFSEPMAEGRSLDHVILLRNNRDTMKGTFLDLQPELWNEDGTLLTLWLDPGRIKRDLIPNKKLGIPLMQGQWYAMQVSPQWKSKQGNPLLKGHAKAFFVTQRDEHMPAVDRWRIGVPQRSSNEPLTVEFGEPLDFSLIHNTIWVVDEKSKVIHGSLKTLREEHGFVFLPEQKWESGQYTLKVESRLEDLAGNNLNRLFDTDVMLSENKKDEKEEFERKFEVKAN